MELAKKSCDKAEVYSLQHNINSVSFENAKLHDIETNFQSGLSLRIIKDNKLGFAYTKNIQNREELIQNALDSLKGGVAANYDFPLTTKTIQLDTYDTSLEEIANTKLVEECSRVCELLKSSANGEIMMQSGTAIDQTRIINTAGTDISFKNTGYYMTGNVIFPGSAAGIIRVFISKKFEPMPDNLIKEIISLYNLSSKVVTPEGGKMKVLFMPYSLFTFTGRILSGTSGKSIYEKISPIADKMGEKIWSDKITVYDDPLNDRYPAARPFDDEGVPTQFFPVVENGVLKNFYYDLNYAGKLKTKPTGHGYKINMWGGDSLKVKPTPFLAYLNIKAGQKSLAQLIKSIDRGIILEGALGGHSGNIPNGDYSVGVCPGMYVENGEIIGRVKDAMIAGNIYQTLKNVVDVGDTAYPLSLGGGLIPPILCAEVSVATKR